MKASIDEFVSILDRLTARLDELEERVAELEHPPVKHAHSIPAHASGIEQHSLSQVSDSSNIMPVIGKIFLGIAGAYVLRAVAESGALPRVAVACVALAYAASWLLWAARASSTAIFASTAYASTAAVILLPMLWELTLRFHVLPASVTASLLVCFVAGAGALAWRRRLVSVVLAPSLSAALAAVVLMLGTRDPLPFMVALLLIALITEAVAAGNRWPGVRPLVAVPVDIALLALIAIYTNSNGVSPEYKPLSAGILLNLFAAFFVIYGASILSHTVVLQRNIGKFEIAQMTGVFLLAGIAVLRVTHGAAGVLLGVFCLLVGAACYWCAYARFRTAELRRNHHVFSTWALVLAVVGSLFSFSVSISVFSFGAAALTALWLGLHWRRFSLAVDAMVYLVMMAVVSGLLQYCGAMFIGEPRPSDWRVWTAYLFTLLCYAFAWPPFGFAAPQWQQKALRLAITALPVCATLAAAMAAGLQAISASTSAAIAAIRTLIICIMALLLGWAASRWRRTESLWLAYALLALCTFKLLAEDLRTGSAGAIAFSLFCYGMVWVLVPRFAAMSKAA